MKNFWLEVQYPLKMIIIVIKEHIFIKTKALLPIIITLPPGNRQSLTLQLERLLANVCYQHLDCNIPHNNSPNVAWVNKAIESQMFFQEILQ